MKQNISTDRRKDARTGYLFILPFVTMFAIFKLYPMVYGFAVSFLNRNSVRNIGDKSFVGFKNYLKVLQNDTFWSSLGNTFTYSLIYATVAMIFAFILAVLINRTFRGRTVVRTMMYVPYVTNVIAIGIVFKYLLNPKKGPINAIFRMFGVEGPKWLIDPDLALPITALIGAWLALAFGIITILAALQDIPDDLYEVATIEGATERQKMLKISLPMIAPALFMLLTITIINSFKSYTIVMALTEGGPGTASRVLSLQIYDDAFNYMKFSIAAAEGVIFTVIVVLINRILNKVRKVWESR